MAAGDGKAGETGEAAGAAVAGGAGSDTDIESVASLPDDKIGDPDYQS